MSVQTRNQDGELKFFTTVKAALEEAKKDKSIWKISFEDDVRLVRKVINGKTYWEYAPMRKVIEEEERKLGMNPIHLV